MAFADGQLRGTLIPEVAACKICHDGKLHMGTHTPTHTHTHTHRYAHIHVHIRTHTRADMHVYTNTCTHIQTNTYLHPSMYTPIPGVGNFTKGGSVFFPPQRLLSDFFYSCV